VPSSINLHFLYQQSVQKAAHLSMDGETMHTTKTLSGQILPGRVPGQNHSGVLCNKTAAMEVAGSWQY
jgi:hypothetical protein